MDRARLVGAWEISCGRGLLPTRRGFGDSAVIHGHIGRLHVGLSPCVVFNVPPDGTRFLRLREDCLNLPRRLGWRPQHMVVDRQRSHSAPARSPAIRSGSKPASPRVSHFVFTPLKERVMAALHAAQIQWTNVSRHTSSTLREPVRLCSVVEMLDTFLQRTLLRQRS